MLIKKEGEKIIIKTNKAEIELADKIKIDDFEIANNGEYEINGVLVELKNEIAIIGVEELTIIYLDGLSRSLTKEETEEMGDVDVLVFPISAFKSISEIEPKIAIPTNYQDLNDFSSTAGVQIEKTRVLKISKNTLGEERRVVALEE